MPHLHKIEELLEIMSRLRAPEKGCPWDRQQTYATLIPYTLEEAYEVADAIGRRDFDELRDELGDLLFQIVFYAQIAKEEKRFGFDDVVDAIAEKLVRRHPHVFSEVDIESAEQQTLAWEEHKEGERARKASAENREPSELDGVSLALPALVRADKLQKRAARVGFDWEDIEQVLDKVGEELNELIDEIERGDELARLEEEIGDVLFSCVNLARHAGVDAEAALRHANQKFESRFRAMESALVGEGKRLDELTLEEMDAVWEQIKERGPDSSAAPE
jgi:ATP diphosphatase